MRSDFILIPRSVSLMPRRTSTTRGLIESTQWPRPSIALLLPAVDLAREAQPAAVFLVCTASLLGTPPQVYISPPLQTRMPTPELMLVSRTSRPAVPSSGTGSADEDEAGNDDDDGAGTEAGDSE